MLTGLISELQRRNTSRVGTNYASIASLIANTDNRTFPVWIMLMLLVTLAVGCPIAGCEGDQR